MTTTINEADVEMLKWLLTAPPDDWNGPMLTKVARRLEALSRENLVLMDSQRDTDIRIQRLNERIAKAAKALGATR